MAFYDMAAPSIDQRTNSGDIENHLPYANRRISDMDITANNPLDGIDEDDEEVTFASSYDEEDDEDDEIQEIDVTSQITAKTVREVSWKPRSETTYETLVLTRSEFNSRVRGAGFRQDGLPRKIKWTENLMSDIRRRCVQRKRKPAMAICITMYNEDEQELKNTLRGVVHNYNCFRAEDDKYNLTKDDFCVTIICDGYDRIPESFKKHARDKGFLDEELLVSEGYMSKDDKGVYKMNDLRDIMDDTVSDDKIPKNILHVWQVTTWDIGLEEDLLKGRRMHIMFAVKHRNDGKINSHKWFFQAFCKYLKPELCLMLDIGTQLDNYALLKLYAHMKADQNCGGCCGEIEVDLDSPNEGGMSTWLLQAAQFFEYKLGHTPDKACESFFGFTQVLPGAYSLFRWQAIKGAPLEEFFKRETRSDVPACSEANEYLAEDRIMCLQIYIKETQKFKLAYVPDAKAFTDAPQSMMVLMKQRRRWMNGALFGTAKVLANFVNMSSCKRTNHGVIRKLGIILFLLYQSTLFMLQFFIVGAMFAAVYAFFDQVFASLFAQNPTFQKIYEQGTLMNVFVYVYIMLLAMCLILSLALPLDRARPCFVIATTLFGILTIATITGMVFYLSAAGFYPQHIIFDKTDYTWTPVEGEYNFSWLVLAGTIMLAVYLIPFVLRPLDFLENFKGYTVGLISYIILIPMFTNIFSIYAMANLHDISWGNRPTTATSGMEAVSTKVNVQKETEITYKAYRANFLFLWFCANGAYFLVVLQLAASTDQYDVNNGQFTVLDGFSMYLASIVVFKVFFAILYVLKWQCRYMRNPKYQISAYNLEMNFKKMKKNANAAESSDDREDREHIAKIATKREATLKHRSRHMRNRAGKKKLTKKDMMEQTKRMILEEDLITCRDDSDDDAMDFMDNEIEEITAKIIQEWKRKRRPLKASEISRVSRGLVDNLKDSVLSNVMVPQEYQYIQQSQQDNMSLYGRPQSKRIIIKSLMDSQRSGFSIHSNAYKVPPKIGLQDVESLEGRRFFNSTLEPEAPKPRANFQSELQLEVISDSIKEPKTELQENEPAERKHINAKTPNLLISFGHQDSTPSLHQSNEKSLKDGSMKASSQNPSSNGSSLHRVHGYQGSDSDQRMSLGVIQEDEARNEQTFAMRQTNQGGSANSSMNGLKASDIVKSPTNLSMIEEEDGVLYQSKTQSRTQSKAQ